ncbi:hypothetical protein MASSI9I_70313 [Massilia sp. 9I]|nr:hypothetical protein MASSI9I_70313 [Massilia sp. 9I]
MEGVDQFVQQLGGFLARQAEVGAGGAATLVPLERLGVALVAADRALGQHRQSDQRTHAAGGRGVLEHREIVVVQDGPADVGRQAPIARQQAADRGMRGRVALVFQRGEGALGFQRGGGVSGRVVGKAVHQQGHAGVAEQAEGVGHVRFADAQAARQEHHGLGAAGRDVPEAGQGRAVGRDRLARQQAGHQGRHLVNPQEQDRLLDRLGLAPSAVNRGIGQLEQGAGHADVARDDLADRFRRRVFGGQFALHVGKQARPRRDADRLDQGIDLVELRKRIGDGIHGRGLEELREESEQPFHYTSALILLQQGNVKPLSFGSFFVSIPPKRRRNTAQGRIRAWPFRQ